MYRILKDGTIVSLEDKARYIKLQSNGVLVLCDEDEAHGIVINNDYAATLEGRPQIPGTETVTMQEFDGAQALAEAQAALNELGVNTDEN